MSLSTVCCGSQSDSDYNPVEEPSWMQNDSLQATHFALQSSPSDSPRILAFGVEESTAVASPVRLPQRQPLRPKQPGNGDLDDIMTFVKDKVGTRRAPFLVYAKY